MNTASKPNNSKITYPSILGRKVGMTQFFAADGTVVRCSVIESGAVVVSKRTLERDGYIALIVGLGERKEKHTNKAQLGFYSRAKEGGVTPKKTLRELRCTAEFADGYQIGDTLRLGDIFKEGQFVDVQGKTRGRGFTGVMRRWGFAGFPKTHGTHEYRRHGGSIGTNMTPGRTLPNVKMPGHYGNETVSVLNLRVAKILPEKNLLLIEGGVPGSREGLLFVRGAIKKKGGLPKGS